MEKREPIVIVRIQELIIGSLPNYREMKTNIAEVCMVLMLKDDDWDGGGSYHEISRI